MKRLNYLVDDMAQNDSSTLKNDVTSIHDEWKRIQLFVMWEFSNRHLKITQKDPVHCCTYALKAAGNAIYNQHCYDKCSDCFTFFDVRVNDLIKRVKDLRSSFDENTQELDSMIASLPKFTYNLIHYMAHRVRAKVQFSAIDKIKTNLESNMNSVLIVIDHKQKVLQQRYREGQVEYYGKKGMSVLNGTEKR